MVIIGLLIGLVLFAIALAVMTALYIVASQFPLRLRRRIDFDLHFDLEQTTSSPSTTVSSGGGGSSRLLLLC